MTAEVQAVIERWHAALRDDLLAVCDPVRLELLYSTRSAKEYAARSEELDALHRVPAGSATFWRALEVADRGSL